MTENKRFNVFDVDGTIFLEDHKEGSYHIGEIGNVDVNCLNDIADRLNELVEENEQLKFENNELKCALALNEVDYIIADGKKIDIPPYYEFEQRYDSLIHRREYDGYD